MDALIDEAWKQSPHVLRAQADAEAAEASIADAFNTDAPFANQGEMATAPAAASDGHGAHQH